jgi:hypothetical protein
MFLSVYSVSLCCSVYGLCVNVYCTTVTGISGHFSATLTEVFPCFFSGVRQIPGYNSQRRSQPAFPFVLIVMYVPFSLFSVLFMYKYVLYYCHRVSTQLELRIDNDMPNRVQN